MRRDSDLFSQNFSEGRYYRFVTGCSPLEEDILPNFSVFYYLVKIIIDHGIGESCHQVRDRNSSL
ncbi:hypothetical protein ES703_46845 [subsurface metagenome]